ncbi:cyclin-dependent kinase C-2-like isoform X2 [Carya illinoinensis]|uniref:cyclin-dependent kinase C-2-like isoform X2 n=1 Tax=Carya illinoinensis TaxID=32201 RepID=UPI001C729090|nr:cyclin-dependent kinase C-2-like isoform X2 [Carya illinoinensis]
MAVAGPGQLNVEEYPSWGSRSVDCFEKLEQIGEGTYGQVYMAREIRTGEIVALKRIRMDNEKEGFPITAIREIKILKKLHHENVIKLKEIVTSPGPETDEQGNQDGNKFKGGIYMVFEYMDHDLTGLADRPGLRFTVPQIKCYMKQLLTGLHYCHVNQVLHRDIKGSNLLIDNEGNLKLADFGLARSFSTDHTGNLTNRVITLWYRPPELLLGATKYGPAVDMWSVGCIFAELLNGKPILPGKNERISAQDALVAEYFWNDPLPCDPKSLPKYESSHEFQTKKKRQQQRQNEETAKRQKLQHPQPHARLPPIQHTGQAHPSHWHGPNHPISNAQPPVSTGTSHHQYGRPRGPPGGPNRYPPSANQSGGYNQNRGAQVGSYSGGPYPPQGRGPPYGGSGMPAPGQRGAASGYGVAPPNYSQSSQFGGSAGGRGPNPLGGNRNQQYWQQ